MFNVFLWRVGHLQSKVSFLINAPPPVIVISFIPNSIEKCHEIEETINMHYKNVHSLHISVCFLHSCRQRVYNIPGIDNDNKKKRLLFGN